MPARPHCFRAIVAAASPAKNSAKRNASQHTETYLTKQKTCLSFAGKNAFKKNLYINEGAHCFSTFSLHNRKTTAMMRTLKHLLRQGHGTKIWKTLGRKTKHFFSEICPSAKTCPMQVSRNRWEPCFKETRKHSWDSPAVHGHCYFAVHPKK